MTPQRRIVLEIIARSSEHLDAAALLQRARERDGHIHRATVYRTLELLKRFRLVDELDLMHLEGEKHYYEARNKSEHFHLACMSCGKIVEHTSPTFEKLKKEISEQTGFSIDVIRLEVGGKCPVCGSDKAAGRAAPGAAGSSRSAQPGAHKKWKASGGVSFGEGTARKPETDNPKAGDPLAV
jgi:Fe2+ or Zn2+ uptake regulation protein